MGGLHIHNWATGKSVHLVVYAGESISRFICHSGAVPRPANHTFPFPDWFSSSSVFINFSLFLRGWISSNNPGCAIPDGVKSASMTPAFI
ncbi:hypothetical protein A31O_05088 [Escherichia coli KTE170]|nr:hypothetical protein A31O_05088 [Escherichia coli KTE170]CSO21219.1 Uncharacterised protein [Shigella sonnei]SJJ19446.1 Uncharacterised protein [Shigella sonnei]SRS89895.1 Uncharacterised protein [Shigella sonnei]VZQ99844.1 Uncharacterised protein [Escherichia coli]